MTSSIYIENSQNTKISGFEKVDCTYIPMSLSCPTSCELMKKGCYSYLGYVGIIVRNLEKKIGNISAYQMAKAEADAINSSYNGKAVPSKNLRLHVSGDSRTVSGTRLINKAIANWKSRGGKTAWSYTHAWRKVLRREWSNVSILASVDSIKEVELARKQGYAPAIVVASFDSDKAFKMKGSNTTWIPCPAQTKDNVACTTCKLCFKADWLYASGKGIAFAAHGAGKELIKRRLKLV